MLGVAPPECVTVFKSGGASRSTFVYFFVKTHFTVKRTELHVQLILYFVDLQNQSSAKLPA